MKFSKEKEKHRNTLHILIGSPFLFNLDLSLRHLREQKLGKSGRQSTITKTS